MMNTAEKCTQTLWVISRRKEDEKCASLYGCTDIKSIYGRIHRFTGIYTCSACLSLSAAAFEQSPPPRPIPSNTANASTCHVKGQGFMVNNANTPTWHPRQRPCRLMMLAFGNHIQKNSHRSSYICVAAWPYVKGMCDGIERTSFGIHLKGDPKEKTREERGKGLSPARARKRLQVGQPARGKHCPSRAEGHRSGSRRWNSYMRQQQSISPLALV